MSHALSARRDLVAWATLLALGFCWGMTGPLSKLAVSTGHHSIGVTFWTAAMSAAIFTALIVIRRERPPLDRRHVIFFVTCGLLGTALPNTVSYEAYRHLPVGINVMVLSLVPMATLLISLTLGLERVDGRRSVGLALGVVGVVLLTGPETALPSADLAIWVALPVIVSISYAAENVYIAARRPEGISTVVVMWGLSVGGLILLTPPTIALNAAFDITALGPAEQAVVGSTILHLFAYFGFVWLIARAGPVFASQVGYVVTGVGVVSGMAIYGEQHSPWVWAALAVMMIGLTLVKPRERAVG